MDKLEFIDRSRTIQQEISNLTAETKAKRRRIEELAEQLRRLCTDLLESPEPAYTRLTLKDRLEQFACRLVLSGTCERPNILLGPSLRTLFVLFQDAIEFVY